MLNEKIEVSKTKRKAHVESLQKLGMELVALSKDKLSKIDLPEILVEAILLRQKLTAHGAIRRQNQHIGKLMHTVDEAYVKEKLAELNSDSAKNILNIYESWCERLLKEDSELHAFICQYGSCNELKNLIRAARREQTLNLVKNQRKLLKLIRDVIENKQFAVT
jgi:ribosome-associated protein